MLRVEIADWKEIQDGKAGVHPVCDQNGLDLLITQLKQLRTANPPHHLHLITPSWAGSDLDEKVNGEDNLLVPHLRIQLVP